MKKKELLKTIDNDLLDKLYGFCYSRTSNSHEAQELCSDILFELVKAANTDGEIADVFPFIWRVARNVYADFSEKRQRSESRIYGGDPDELFDLMVYDEGDDKSIYRDKIQEIYKRIAFLTVAYREVMISYYLDGLSTKEIAKRQGTSEVAVRQRLFSARRKIKNEVDNMTENNKPVNLDNIDYIIWGSGTPDWDDPRNVCTRRLSKHIVWLCRNKPMSATEIAAELNIPTLYVEEELEILTHGEKGKYGLLRKLDNGKYIINFVLLEKDVFEAVNQLYINEIPKICNVISKFIEEHKDEYLSFPYINKKVDLNLIIWQQIHCMSNIFATCVERALEKYLGSIRQPNREFSVYGYVDNGKHYGGGCDGTSASNICEYTYVQFVNIYVTRLKAHFRYGHNISRDPEMILAIRAIDGINVNTLTEGEKEIAAKAIEEGYLYREGDTLYTKILTCNYEDKENLFGITQKLMDGYFGEEVDELAKSLFKILKKAIPDHLLDEWHLANSLANLPVLDALIESLIERGILTPPENGLGAEGCWMAVKK